MRNVLQHFHSPPCSFIVMVVWLKEMIHSSITAKPNTHASYLFWLGTPSNNDHRRQTRWNGGAGVSGARCSSWLSRWPVKEPQ